MSDKQYSFGVYVTIEGIDYEDALYNFEQMLKSFGVIDSYNFEIEEIA
jgi:hypothetical protein